MVRILLKYYIKVQNWEIKIILFFMLGIYRILFNIKLVWGVLREVELVWVMERPDLSLIIMSLEPMYSIWNKRLLKLEITWWRSPLFIIHDGGLRALATKWALDCHDEVVLVINTLKLLIGDWTGTEKNKGMTLNPVDLVVTKI